MQKDAWINEKNNQTPDDDQDASSSWSMELSRWRVRLRRLKRWSRYEGRASDGQFDTSDLPEEDGEETPQQRAQPKRHSLTSVDTLRGFDATRYARSSSTPNQYVCSEPVVPPVRIPTTYRQQDRQRGVRVGGDRVPFTLDGHMRRRKMVRPLLCIEESTPLDELTLPDMRNSMAAVYAMKGRSRRACSV